MDARELAEWEAYELIEPFGQVRGDLQAGVIAAEIVNIVTQLYGKKKDKRATPADFLLKFEKPKPKQPAAQPWQNIMNNLRLIAARHNAKLEQKNGGS